MKIHYLNAKGEEIFIGNIIHLQNVDNYTWIATTKSGKELTLRTERIEGVADMGQEKTCTYQEYSHLDWTYWECSNCKEPFCFNNDCTPEENQYHYCPNCGARITEYKGLYEDER